MPLFVDDRIVYICDPKSLWENSYSW
jgi:hypothetical protein